MTTEFTLVGAPIVAPTATLPVTCRLSGFFVNHLGQPLKGMKVRVISMDHPIVSSTLGVLGETAEVQTDVAGFIQFDCFRDSYVKFQFGARSEQIRICYVPNAASASILDVAFPRLSSLTLALNPVSAVTGATSVVTVTGVLSDTRTMNVAAHATLLSSAPVHGALSGTTITAGVPGATTITISAFDYAAFLLAPGTPVTDPTNGVERDGTEPFWDSRQAAFVISPTPAPTLGAGVVFTAL